MAVETPTTDERVLRLTRYMPPDKAVARLPQRLGKTLPGQPPPKLISPGKLELPGGFVVKTYAVSPRKIPAKPGSVKK